MKQLILYVSRHLPTVLRNPLSKSLKKSTIHSDYSRKPGYGFPQLIKSCDSGGHHILPIPVSSLIHVFQKTISRGRGPPPRLGI